jgi:hypothetical protein
MAETRRLSPEVPTAPYDILYVGSHRYPGTNPLSNQPTADTEKDVYQTALVFAAATAMAKRSPKPTVKVALLGDAVFAVHRDHSKKKPKPGTRPTVESLINDLPRDVDIWC